MVGEAGCNNRLFIGYQGERGPPVPPGEAEFWTNIQVRFAVGLFGRLTYTHIELDPPFHCDFWCLESAGARYYDLTTRVLLNLVNP